MKNIISQFTKIILLLLISMGISTGPLFSQEARHDLLLIGDTVPSFEAPTSQGIMNFPDVYSGMWKIIFSHPGDFTPVCTSELLSFALMHNDFRELNCELIGLSVDGYDSHLDWISSMENIHYKGQDNIKVEFPIISDVNREIATMFGMVHPNAMSTRTIRAVYIIDTDNIVNAILYYPDVAGRSIKEIKRLLIALQTVKRCGVATPAEWQPGDDVIVPVPQTAEMLKDKEEKVKAGDIYCLDWYFCFKKL